MTDLLPGVGLKLVFASYWPGPGLLSIFEVLGLEPIVGLFPDFPNFLVSGS